MDKYSVFIGLFTAVVLITASTSVYASSNSTELSKTSFSNSSEVASKTSSSNSTDSDFSKASSSASSSDNSTELSKASSSSSASLISKSKDNNDTSTLNLSLLTKESENATESSKKDKRQAQRGYTDIPLDEGQLNDITNSSPNPLPGFDTDLPPLAEKFASLASNYFLGNGDNSAEKILGTNDNSTSFFSEKIGYPAQLNDNIAAPAIPSAAIALEGPTDYFDSTDGKPIPGEAGRDYPVYARIPRTSFSCKSQQWPGYYADTEARCQVFWICQKHRMDAFLCPNGTLFNQQVFVCDWWFNVDCEGSPQFYSRNQFLYQGPQIGIDGQRTRFGGAPPAAATVFANSVLPKPSGVNSNPLVNRVQSSNQVARLATVPPTPLQPKFSPTPSYNAASSNTPTARYTARPQQKQHFSANVPAKQAHFSNTKYVSHQTMLTDRMQKHPTSKPQFGFGGHVSQYSTTAAPSFPKEKSQNSQSELDRRSFSADTSLSPKPFSSSFSAGGRSSAFQETSQFSTGRPQFSISTTLKPPAPTQVPIGSASSVKSSLTPINIVPGTTSRPKIILSTTLPMFNPGSSTLRSPQDIVQEFTEKSPRLIASREDFYNVSTHVSTRRPAPSPTTRVPKITTTFRSTTTSYSSNSGFTNNNANTGIPFSANYNFGTPTPSPAPRSHNFPTSTNNYHNNGGSSSNKIFVSTTNRPPHSPTKPIGFFGQRSNQFSNLNGQREVMYSPTTLNAYVEYPYSPSQQRNKLKLLELQASKGISTPAKDLFSYPHFQGQRSKLFSAGDSVSYISNNNKQVTINHISHSQRINPFVSSNVVSTTPRNPAPVVKLHSTSNRVIPNAQVTPTRRPNPPVTHNQQTQLSQQNFNQPTFKVHPNAHRQQTGKPSPPHPQNFQSNPLGQAGRNINHAPVQSFANIQSVPPQSQQIIPKFIQNQPQSFHQQIRPVVQTTGSYLQNQRTESSTTSPFHKRIIQAPMEKLQLPATPLSHRPGYTSLKSGSYISIQTSPTPFSKQILKHSEAIQNASPKAFVTTKQPFFYSTAPNTFISPPAPYASEDLQTVSTTLKPPPLHSTVRPFTNNPTQFPFHNISTATVSSNSVQTTFRSQNRFLAAPTKVPVRSTSPGHRQNPYLPHKHGKRKQPKRKKQPTPQPTSKSPIKYRNSVITTTIKYPEGTGSLKIGIPTGGSKKHVVDFSYTANPKSTTPAAIRSTTTRPATIAERFNRIVASTTLRPLNPSSPSPQYHREKVRVHPRGRLAGAVVNKSTSSSSAIYVDTGARAQTAESVSTPVSVSPSPSAAPVATSNYGLRISTTAKKRMAGAWQQYFNGEKQTKREDSTNSS